MGTIKTFFEPRGVLVVGASSKPNKLGYGIAKNLISCGYQGNLAFVNPKGGEILGRKVYKAISEVDLAVNLAVLLIPAEMVLEALKECAQIGIEAVIISSGGFREIGEDGIEIENQIIEFVKKNSIRIIGPNCIGILDNVAPINTTFLQEDTNLKGTISFVSHSGAICAALLNWANTEGIGFNKLISLGNQADVNETELIQFLLEDKSTEVLSIYLEGISNGEQFINAAHQFTKKKPIIAIKAGRFESGKKAIASHTGALAGSDTAFGAAFRRAGILRAESLEELITWANTLSVCAIPAGDRVAVLTNAGGPGVAAADMLEKNNLKLSRFQSHTINLLKQQLPPHASLNNPVDMLASASPEDYKDCLEILLSDENVDSVLVLIPPPPMFSAIEVCEAMSPVIKKFNNKPVVVSLFGGKQVLEAKKYLIKEKIPVYTFPENAANAIGVLSKYGAIRKNSAELPKPDAHPIREISELLTSSKQNGLSYLPDSDVKKVLSSYQIPIPPSKNVNDYEFGLEAAKEIGYPIALKLIAQDFSHKADIGGVYLNIETDEQFYKSFEELTLLCEKQKIFDYSFEIQKMIPQGQEIVCGIMRDPQFGPLLMFGSGGTEVEGLKDVQFVLSPPTAEEIQFLFDNTWAGKRMKGYRNISPIDSEKIEQILLQLSQIATDYPQIQEIEINPIIALPKGHGQYAVDARIKVN